MKLIPINIELIIERIKYENPWWINGLIDDLFNSMKRRLYFEQFFPLIEMSEIRRAVVLMGPRRIGKTVMLFHSIQKLLDNGINKQKIFFISIDNPIYMNRGLEELFLLTLKSSGSNSAKDCYVFFDEIQYLKDWEIHLKILVDSYPNTKFVVSGSAAAALKLKSAESGTGRFTEFMLPSLTFNEYINLMNLDHLIIPSKSDWKGNVEKFISTININELNKHFVNYINFGGYPEVIFSERIQKNPGRYIKSDIIDKVLLRDLPSLYGIQDVQELNSFFSTLAYYSGNEVSLESLSKSSGVEKKLLKKYIEYLEAAFLIKVIHRIDDTAKRFQRATFYKIYLTNPSLRTALFSPIGSNDDNIGNMVETTVFSQWAHSEWFKPYYARWSNGKFQGEVDMIGLNHGNLKPKWALEIKWSNRYFERPTELKSLIQFCEKNNLSQALVTTIDKEGIKKVGNLEIFFVPVSIYSYIIGLNTLL
jgi:predicted AAA+ superfamily ATPase